MIQYQITISSLFLNGKVELYRKNSFKKKTQSVNVVQKLKFSSKKLTKSTMNFCCICER